ncbi:MAG: proprotein convertase P-domain-containing protein [bacterium]
MRLSNLTVLVAGALLLGVGAASADKQSELREQALKPWSLTNLPEFGVILADVNETEPLNNTCPGEPYAYGDTYHGTINPAADQDWVSFSANAGDLLTLGTDADGSPAVGDTYIELYSSNCTTLLTSDDDSGPGLYSLISAFAAPYTGSYYLKIRAYSATATGGYKFIGTKQGGLSTVCPLDNYKGQKYVAQVTVPDNNPAGVNIGPIVFPPDGSAITDVVADLQMTHTWVGDLIVRLTHIGPGGTQSVDLLNRPGVPNSTVGCSGDLVATDTNKYYFGTGNLATLGETSCPAQIPPQCYLPAPESPAGMSAFRGYPKDGEWWLFVSDNAGGDVGVVQNFSVHILNTGVVAVEPSSWGQIKSSYR